MKKEIDYEKMESLAAEILEEMNFKEKWKIIGDKLYLIYRHIKTHLKWYIGAVIVPIIIFILGKIF